MILLIKLCRKLYYKWKISNFAAKISKGKAIIIEKTKSMWWQADEV